MTVGIVLEEFGVAAPTDGGFKLALGFLFAEVLVEQIVEELLGGGVVLLGFESAGDLAEDGDVGEDGLAEELLLAEDFGVGELVALRGDLGIALFDLEEAELTGGIDDGEQIVEFKGKLFGEAVHIFAAVGAVVDQFEQSGDAAGTGVGEHLVRGTRGTGGGRQHGSGVSCWPCSSGWPGVVSTL